MWSSVDCFCRVITVNDCRLSSWSANGTAGKIVKQAGKQGGRQAGELAINGFFGTPCLNTYVHSVTDDAQLALPLSLLPPKVAYILFRLLPFGCAAVAATEQN